MESMKDRLRNDLHAAMRAHDRVRRDTIRSLLSSLGEAEDKAGRPLTAPDALNVVSQQVTVRREAILEYERADRSDLASTERAELSVLEDYLPPALGEDELSLLIQGAIRTSGATEPRHIGLVMKEVVPLIRGRADAEHAKDITRVLLEEASRRE